MEQEGQMFIHQPDEPTASQEVQVLLRELYELEKKYRSQVLASPPGSAQRAELGRAVFCEIYSYLDRIFQKQGLQFYSSGFADKSDCAASIRNLSGARDARCIEIGAGGGSLCHAIAKTGWPALGLDIVEGPDWKKITTQTAGRAEFRVCDITIENDLPWGTFDICIMDGALEHIPDGDYMPVLKKVWKLLKPGGWFVVSMPNPLSGPHDVSKYFVARGRPAECGHYNERTVRQLLRDFKNSGFCGFKSVVARDINFGSRLPLMNWSGLWLLRALFFEGLFSVFLPQFIKKSYFSILVPCAVAARKR